MRDLLILDLNRTPWPLASTPRGVTKFNRLCGLSTSHLLSSSPKRIIDASTRLTKKCGARKVQAAASKGQAPWSGRPWLQSSERTRSLQEVEDPKLGTFSVDYGPPAEWHRGDNGSDGTSSRAPNNRTRPASGLHDKLLAATEWRELTGLVSAALPGCAELWEGTTGSGASPHTEPASSIGDEPGSSHYQELQDGLQGPGGVRHPAGRPKGAAKAAGLRESELLLVLWRVVCGLLQQRSTGQRALLPPPALPTAPSVAVLANLSRQPGWLGALSGSASAAWLGVGFAADAAAAPCLPPAVLAGSCVWQRRCVQAVAAAAALVAPSMKPRGLMAAVQLLMQLKESESYPCVALLHDLRAAEAPSRSIAAASNINSTCGFMWQLAQPFLRAAISSGSIDSPRVALALVTSLPVLNRAGKRDPSHPAGYANDADVAGGEVGSRRQQSDTAVLGDQRPSELAQALVEAVLLRCIGDVGAVMPSLQKMCICTAAAANCGYLPPASWFALLESELRNQIFLVSAGQGSVLLAALDRLLEQTRPRLSDLGGAAVSTRAYVGGNDGGGVPDPERLLSDGPGPVSSEWVGMIWTEVCGKAAAADAATAAEALREMAWFQEAGLLPPPDATPAGMTGARRIAYVVGILCGRLAPHLPGVARSGSQLAALLTAAAQMARYEAAVLVDSAHGQDSVAEGAGSAFWRWTFVEGASRALLKGIRSRGMGFRQLASSLVALASLAADGCDIRLSKVSELPAATVRDDEHATAAADLQQARALKVLREVVAEAPPELLRRSFGPARRAARRLAVATMEAAPPADMGPSELVWLPSVEVALRHLGAMAASQAHGLSVYERGLSLPLPLPARPLPHNPVLGEPSTNKVSHGDAGVATRAAVQNMARSTLLSTDIISNLLSGCGRMGTDQLLHLVAAAHHPWTARLFDQAARRDVLLAAMQPPPQQTNRPDRRARTPPMAAAAPLVRGLVRGLYGPAFLEVLRAAVDRLLQGLTEAEWAPAVVLAAGLDRLLELAPGGPESQSSFMRDGGIQVQVTEHPQAQEFDTAESEAAWTQLEGKQQAAQQWQGRRDAATPGHYPALSGAEWCELVGILTRGVTALEHADAQPETVTPGVLMGTLLRALAPIWPSLDLAQTVDTVTHISVLHETLVNRTSAGGARGAPGSAPRSRRAAHGPGGRITGIVGLMHGSGEGDASLSGSADEWQVLQRAVAAKMSQMNPRQLLGAVEAAARVAAAAPLCDEWMEALTAALLAPQPQQPPAMTAVHRGLDGLKATEVLLLVRACVDLKVAAANSGAVGLPVLPLLERLGAQLLLWQPQFGTSVEDAAAWQPPALSDSSGPEQSLSVPLQDVCHLLPRLALLASDPALAAVLGDQSLPLLAYLQRCSFRNVALADLQAALQGVSGLMLAPSRAWAAALCDATMHLVGAEGETSLSDLAALAARMAQAWVLPTAEWHAAFLATTLHRMSPGSDGGLLPAGGVRVLEDLLLAQALWTRLCGNRLTDLERPDDSARASAGRNAGALVAPTEWLDALAAAAAQFLPEARPRVLASMPHLFNVLGHDPGPNFIAALLQGCSSCMPEFSGRQLSRLALGLAGLGYQPEDPWVARLHLQAARRLHNCDPHELADLLEGMLLLAEGCEGAGGGGDAAASASGTPAAVQPQVAFLQAFWSASGKVLAREAALAVDAVRRKARRQDLAAVEAVKTEFRHRVNDPRVSHAWRFWTEQVPLLDPTLAAPDVRVQVQMAALSQPLLDGAAGSEPDAMTRLQRFTLWSVLRRGTLPQAWPEGVSPWLGVLALRCAQLLGDRSMRGLQQSQQGGLTVGPAALAFKPPGDWLVEFMRCQTWVMALGGSEAALKRSELLAVGHAAVTWGVMPTAEWCEAFLQASRGAFFPQRRDQQLHHPHLGLHDSRTSKAQLLEEQGVHGQQTQDLAREPAKEATGSGEEQRTSGGPLGSRWDVRSDADVESDLTLAEVLQLLSVVLALDLAPGDSWLQAVESASLLLLRTCLAEDGIALCLAMHRLGHKPARRWAAGLLAATRQPAGHDRIAAADSAFSSAPGVAALLVALASMSVRPPDSWLEGALAGLHGRHAELSAPLRAQLLAALPALEVEPASDWLAPHVDAFWASLSDLLPPPPLLPPGGASMLVSGLSAVSALGVPVKHSQMAVLLNVMAERLGVAATTTEMAGASLVASLETKNSTVAAEVATVLICLGEMRRATPNRANRQLLDILFTAVAERLPVAGPLTSKLLNSWDKLVPM